MNILLILVPMAILIAGFFLGGFFWASWSDQYEDLESPAHRMLLDDLSKNFEKQNKNKEVERG